MIAFVVIRTHIQKSQEVKASCFDRIYNVWTSTLTILKSIIETPVNILWMQPNRNGFDRHSRHFFYEGLWRYIYISISPLNQISNIFFLYQIGEAKWKQLMFAFGCCFYQIRRYKQMNSIIFLSSWINWMNLAIHQYRCIVICTILLSGCLEDSPLFRCCSLRIFDIIMSNEFNGKVMLCSLLPLQINSVVDKNNSGVRETGRQVTQRWTEKEREDNPTTEREWK